MSAWSIPLDRFADKTGIKLETIVRKVTFDLFSKVILRSPVDTGRFRANWNVAYGAPNLSTSSSVGNGAARSEAAKALTLPVGGVTYLANGLPYARRLEFGWSKQAPSGMVRLSAQEFNAFVRKAVAS